jgi:hypothetical protein
MTNLKKVVSSADNSTNEAEEKQETKKEKDLHFNQSHFLSLYDLAYGTTEIKALINDDRGTLTLEEKNFKDKDTGKFSKRLVPVKLSSVKIHPVKIMMGETKKFVQLSVQAFDVPQLVTCDLSSLSNLSKKTDDLQQYANAGGPLNKQLGLKLADVTVYATRAGLIESVKGYELTGWNSEEVHVRPGDNFYIGNLPLCVEKVGDFKSFKDAVNNLLDKNGTVQASLPLAFAVGGYVMGLSGFTVEGSPLYNLFSDSSSVGKSTLQKIIQSFQKNPSILFNANSTRVGAEFSLAAENNGYMCIEELHGMITNERRPVQKIMDLASGGNRQLGAKGGSGLAVARKWHNVIITSANLSLNSLAEGDEQKEALAARIIENNCVENPLFYGVDAGVNIKSCMSVINENYGTAYPAIIEYIKENLGELRFLFADFEKTMHKIIGDQVNGVVERKISACALAFVGGAILENIGINLHADYVEALKQTVIDASYVYVQSDEEKERDIRDDMLSLFNGILSATTINGYLAKSLTDCGGDSAEVKQAVLAKDHNEKKSDTYAVLDQKTPMTAPLNADGYLWVSNSKGAKDFVLRKTGLSLDSLARRADIADRLVVQDSARKQKRLTSQKKGAGRGYVFLMSDFGAHLDGSDYD